MFGLFKKHQKQQSFNGKYNGLHTDMHSHLLPGIDDGSPDVETSIQLIKGMMELGYKKFITTPHIYPDLYPNNTEAIQKAHAVLTQGLRQEQLNVEVIAAAEYFMDEQFSERIDRKEPLLTIHQNWVLVEISFVSPPADLNETIFKMVLAGYQPILAHPERYRFYYHNKEMFQQFKDRGCMLQINLLSLSGYYGKSAQETARMLVAERLVDLVGTDLHHNRHLQAMNNPALMAEVDALVQSGRILNPTL